MVISKVNFRIMLEMFDKEIGDRKSELIYSTDYQFLISVLLSAQSTDKAVNKATESLFKIVKVPADMLKLGEVNLKIFIKSIGFYNVKSRHIINLSEVLISKFDGEVPLDFESLITLAGIGRKSANVILNEILGTPTIGVDTHVIRLVKRLNLVPMECKTPVQIEEYLNKTTPIEYKSKISNFLVLFGRYNCKAMRPKCDGCKFSIFCNK